MSKKKKKEKDVEKKIKKEVKAAAKSLAAAGKAAVAKPVKKGKPVKATKAVKPAKKKAAVVITTEDIALRAYFIAESRQARGEHGDEHGDWVEAERQLRAEAGHK